MEIAETPLEKKRRLEDSPERRTVNPEEPAVLSIEFVSRSQNVFKFESWREEVLRVDSESVKVPLLKEIFDYLSVPDLLRCSLVCRSWNLHSRAVLRDKKKCVAEVVGHRPCYMLKKLNNCLRNSQNVPFNGLSVILTELSHSHHCIKCRDLSEGYANVLTKINIKYFRIYWGEDWRCPAVRLIKKILLERAGDFEGLDVMRLPTSTTEFFQTRPQNWLSNLKSLEIPSEEDPKLERVVLEKLVAEPLKLTEIFGIISAKQLPFLFSKNSAGAVKDFMLHPKSEQAELCMNFALVGPRLRKLFVSSYRFVQGESVERFSLILKLLVNSSCHSLQKLDMEHLDFILLSHCGIRPLTQLNYLTVGYCPVLDDNEGYSTLKRVDFSNLFPNLRSIEIHADSLGEQDIAGFITDKFRGNPQEFACQTVTELKLPQMFYHIDPESFQMFGQLFPNVKDFYTCQCEQVGPFLKELWTTWPDLEVITFEMTQDRYAEDNFDDIFCGIALEEVEYLMDWDEEELEKYQFAPSQPSIRNLEKLKKLRLELLHQTECNTTEDPEILIASHVTGFLAWKRMPSIQVEISTEECTKIEGLRCRFKLDHLKPFVNLIESRSWV